MLPRATRAPGLSLQDEVQRLGEISGYHHPVEPLGSDAAQKSFERVGEIEPS
jgi:hypothetical protein